MVYQACLYYLVYNVYQTLRLALNVRFSLITDYFIVKKKKDADTSSFCFLRNVESVIHLSNY